MVKARDISLKFRDGEPGDAAQIADLGSQTFSETFGHIYKKSDLDAYLEKYFSIDRVTRDLNDEQIDYRVAETASSMVGYAKIGPAALPLTPERRSAIQLHRLYVRETRQGVGVGGILLSWAIARSAERGASELCLGVWSNNKHAISVYENRGFKAEGYYDITVGDSVDRELIMALPLKTRVSSNNTL